MFEGYRTFLLYQMVILYSPVQILQEYPTFTSYIQERVLYNWNVLKTTQTATSPFASHKWAASDHQYVRHSCRSSHTFSRSGGVAQHIIVGWSGSEFQTGNSSIKLQKWRSEVWSWYCGEQNLSITSCNLSVPLQTSVVLNWDIHYLQCNCLLKLKRTMLKMNYFEFLVENFQSDCCSLKNSEQPRHLVVSFLYWV